MWIFLLLIAVPLTEIALFIVIGDEIGLSATLAIVLVTALLGAITLRTQGMQTLKKLSALRADEEAPVVLIEGLMIAAAGLLLLTPGFLTDSIGFLLLAPPIRHALARRAVAKAVVFAARGVGAGSGPSHPHHRASGPSTPPGGRQDASAPGGDAGSRGDRGAVEDATVLDESGPDRS